MGRSRFTDGEAGSPHVLTCTEVGWRPVFTRPSTDQIRFDSWQSLHDPNRRKLLGCIVLENHVHFIGRAHDLSREVGDFMPCTARRIIDHLVEHRVATILDGLKCRKARPKRDRPCQLWREGSHPKVIETEAMMRQKLESIHDNPVKRSHVADPAHRRDSIARTCARIESLMSVITDW